MCQNCELIIEPGGGTGLPLPFARRLGPKLVTTLHGAAMLENDSRQAYRMFADMPYVSISHAERESCPELNYIANVYNGIRLEAFDFVASEGRHLLFLGRICPEKGADLAVEFALRTGLPLVIAGLVPEGAKDFFEARIKPRIDGKQIRFAGEVGPEERNRLLGGALALLHLIRVPEPFGLVMAEAMACGTPVVGIGLGSVPEVVEHGVTGFVARDLDEAVAFAEQLPQLNRRHCRERVERLFTLERMVEGYERAFERLAEAGAGR
jgi:Glycosyltransferase